MKTTFSVCDYRRKARPHLKAVVRWKDQNGKWQTKFFNTKLEAKTFAQQRETELLNQGREALNFPSWLRVMAQECHGHLQKFDKTIRDASEFYLAHLRRQRASVPVETAVAEYLAAAKTNGITRDYFYHLCSKLGEFARRHAGRLMNEFTTKECEDWLNSHDVSGRSHNNYLKQLSAFMAWCARPQRGYLEKNPTREIDFRKEIDNPVGILTPDELHRLLLAATPEMLAFVAIGAFAGLRVAEILRLDWSEVDMEDGFIEVTAKKSKTGTRRLVKILPCLAAWLRPLARESGRIMAVREIWPRRALLCARAGIADWPANALRHSFASYHLAHFKDAAALALEMGHMGTAMIFKHYRQVVREAAAAHYWTVFPDHMANVLPMAMRNAEEMASPLRKNHEGHFVATHSSNYRLTADEYAARFKVGPNCIRTWMRQGRPLDDDEAMQKLWQGKYRQSAEHYAGIYGKPVGIIRQWMRFGWALDNVEATKKFLADREAGRGTNPARAEAWATVRAAKVSPMEAPAEANEPRAARRA